MPSTIRIISPNFKFTGIPIKDSKTIPPSDIVPIHGIEVDTVHFQARLPVDKLVHLKIVYSHLFIARQLYGNGNLSLVFYRSHLKLFDRVDRSCGVL